MAAEPHSLLGEVDMTVRQIVKIDEEKCDGCGQCIIDCPEGALKLIDGKARMVKESFCDGLGVCIGGCPQDAITIEEREADAFDEEAVQKNMAAAEAAKSQAAPTPCACPGSALREMARPQATAAAAGEMPSQLGHWPIQLTLVPPQAPFLQGADVLLAADCAPFAIADFHARFLQGRALLVGCPKLDDSQSYVRKLADILKQAAIKRFTIVRMEVPCCSGLCQIMKLAMEEAGLSVPVRDVTLSVDGRVIAERDW